MRRTLSFLPNNQVEQHADFRYVRDRSGIRTAFSIASASANVPDVPLQIDDCVNVIGTVRDCVRELESGKRAN